MLTSNDCGQMIWKKQIMRFTNTTYLIIQYCISQKMIVTAFVETQNQSNVTIFHKTEIYKLKNSCFDKYQSSWFWFVERIRGPIYCNFFKLMVFSFPFILVTDNTMNFNRCALDNHYYSDLLSQILTSLSAFFFLMFIFCVSGAFCVNSLGIDLHNRLEDKRNLSYPKTQSHRSGKRESNRTSSR